MKQTMTKHIRPESDLYTAHFLSEHIFSNVNEKLAQNAEAKGIDTWYHDADDPEESWYVDDPAKYNIYTILFYAKTPDEAYEKAMKYISDKSDKKGVWYYFGDGGRQWFRYIGLLDLDIVWTSSKELPKEIKKEEVHLSIIDWATICDSNGQPKVPNKKELTIFKEYPIIR